MGKVAKRGGVEGKKGGRATRERTEQAEETVAARPGGDDQVEDDDDGGMSLFAPRPAAKSGGAGPSGSDPAGPRSAKKQKRPSEAGGEAKGGRNAGEADQQTGGKGILQDVLEERDFEALGLESWLVSACASVGMKRPTDVQWNCIPPVLEGRNVLASAETGSGKTAAFALPILQLLARDPYGIFALVLTPTRELAFQIQDQFAALGSKISLRFTTVVGGMDMMHQAVALCKRPHVVVATPGRLADHVRSSHGVADALRRTKFLVLDEADRMLEPTFERDMAAVLEVLPPKRTTLLFSATITASIEALKDMAFKDCFQFEAQRITTVTTVREKYCHVPAMVKDAYLVHLVRSSPAKSLIVFAGTRAACQLVALLLGELGQEVAALHSDLRQARRLAALDTFKAGRARVLVATDVAGRGLDIPSVDLVLNYDIPKVAKDYIHRVGRTARAGRAGEAVSLVTQYDVALVHNIEEETGKRWEDAGVAEEEVLPLMTEVMKAKRVAKVKLLEVNSQGQDDKRRGGLKRKQA